MDSELMFSAGNVVPHSVNAPATNRRKSHNVCHDEKSGLLRSIVDACSKMQKEVGTGRPWRVVAQAVVELLRRHSAGLAFCAAADEVVIMLRRSGSNVPSLCVVRGSVVALHEGDGHPKAWEVIGDADAGIRYFLCVHSAHMSIDVRPGVCIRVRPVPLPADVSRQVPFGPASGLSLKVNAADGQRLLPCRQVVFEMSVEGDLSFPGIGEFPERASQLLTEETLMKVWTSRNISPDWVSGEIVDVRSDTVHVRDVNDVTSIQHSVALRLRGADVAFVDLLKVGDKVLFFRPVVSPTGRSFDLELSKDTIVYARSPSEPCSPDADVERGVFHVPETCSQFVVPPPLKRLRKSDTEDLRNFEDPHLANDPSPVRPELVAGLVSPSSQTPFSMFVVAGSLALSVEDGEGNVALEVLADGCLRLRFASICDSPMHDTVSRIFPGSVLWLQDVLAVSQCVLKVKRFVDVSRLRGCLCSPFVRHFVPVLTLNDPDFRRPDTVHVFARVDDIALDTEQHNVNVSVSDDWTKWEETMEDAPKAKKAHTQSSSSDLVLTQGPTFEEFLGIPFSEFWFGTVNKVQREHRISEVLHSHHIFAVALGRAPDASLQNSVLTSFRVP